MKRTSTAKEGKLGHGPIQWIPPSELRPSPENEKLYRPVQPDDPEIRQLAQSIAAHGVREPLVASEDGYIISGHRRHTAARVAGLDEVPIRTEPIRREDDPDGFLVLLREHNRQREKSADERMREEVLSIDPDDAHAELLRHQAEKTDLSDFRGQRVQAGSAKRRKNITDAKQPMLRAIQKIIEDHRKYLPISERQIHYSLLNDPPLRHARKPDSTYHNAPKCADDLSDLATRARLTGDIDMDAIADESRPIIRWRTHPTPGQFIKCELDQLFRGYHRDLQRSQPRHTEILCEKLALGPIIKPVAGEYGIPMTLGRGFSSIPLRRDMAERFKASGKDKCVLLVLADFDPEGIAIGESFTRSMRDEFDVESIESVRVALNREQAEQHDLPESVEAKKTSTNYKRFVQTYGSFVWELEALEPDELQRILREGIESVMDTQMYEAEVSREKQDARYLKAARRQVCDALSGLEIDELDG